MFSQFPDARVAVTHDDDWCALIEDVCLSNRNGYDVAYSFVKADEQFPDDEELLIRVHRKYTPVLESGIQHELLYGMGP